MKRCHMNKLLEWYRSPYRKPLILDGARQVGKTWIAKEFGQTTFAKTAYINFMDNERMADLFASDISPKRLIPALSIESGVAIEAPDTLIILDEIQEVPRALTSLKYFYEDAPEYAVIATGSSMGVTLHQGFSYPVGKVQTQHLYPMTFCEFLNACGKENLTQVIMSGDLELMKVFHNTLMEQLRYYLLVGGMPEVVMQFVSSLPGADFDAVRKKQEQILADYRADFSKHEGDMPRGLVVRLNQVWNSLPSQLARENKKFLYNVVRAGGRGRDFELAIQWLKDCSLVHKITKVNPPQCPLAINEDFEQFKLFVSDVGLLSAALGIDLRAALEGERLFGEAQGCLAEQYVCQQLTAMGIQCHYWQADNSSAELDFVVQCAGQVVPIEVKSGSNLRSRSLASSIKRFDYKHAVRFSAARPSVDGAIHDVPLYAIESEKTWLPSGGLH